MRRRPRYICKCGSWINGSQTVCSKCSPYSQEPHDNTENPTFLLTSEISEGNISHRLREGFKLLNLNNK